MNNEVLIPITMFLCAFGALYVFFTTRNKERMALIEKGADPAMFQVIRDSRTGSLKFGMFLVGIALGILCGSLLDTYTQLLQEVCYFSMIFLFGGSSLIIFYLFVGKKDQ